MNSQVIENCLDYVNDCLESIDRLDLDLESERKQAEALLRLLIKDLQVELDED